jgi:hypothetical protein
VYGFLQGRGTRGRNPLVRVEFVRAGEYRRTFTMSNVVFCTLGKFRDISIPRADPNAFVTVARDQHGKDAVIRVYSAEKNGAIMRHDANMCYILRSSDAGVSSCVYATVDNVPAHIAVYNSDMTNMLVPVAAEKPKQAEPVVHHSPVAAAAQKIHPVIKHSRAYLRVEIHADELYERRYAAKAQLVRYSRIMNWARTANTAYETAKKNADNHTTQAYKRCAIYAEMAAVTKLAHEAAEAARAAREEGSF